MSDSVYKVVELVGSSSNSFAEAAKNAVEKAGENLRDLRIAEVERFDVKISNGKVEAYRARLKVSFKYEG